MTDSQSVSSLPGSPGWVRPNDLMKSRSGKLKARRRALEARMSTSQPLQILMPVVSKQSSSPRNGLKRRNPFRCVQNKSIKFDPEGDSSENSTDATLFQLINPKVRRSSSLNNEVNYNSFSEALKATERDISLTNHVKDSKIFSSTLNVDWSLKSSMRFFSSKPLPWKQTFKSIEEASGTTGFVRCLNSEIENQRLDTSTNTKFYECCLVWQHPCLPTLTLFPRDKRRKLGHTGMYGTDPKLASALLADWSESLRSLYQLLRVRMCPYFYVCAHSFTCLFRAAGVGGVSHSHALITPTTRGFRDALKNEGVEFSMPYLTNDNNDELETNLDDEKIDDEKTSSFLDSLGLDSSQFPSLGQNRIKQETKKFRGIDGHSQSLVYVEDMELQGLINFLLNCSSCVVTTGELAGVPPTLLAPNAFHGATLKSLKISGGPVRNSKGEVQHSVEVRGPILPTTVLHMSNLLSSLLQSFSLSLTPINSTSVFSSLLPSKVEAKANMAFSSEGLVDCGLGEDTRAMICNVAEDTSEEEKLPVTYKEVIYENESYHWTDK